jgi:hypothetical protein
MELRVVLAPNTACLVGEGFAEARGEADPAGPPRVEVTVGVGDGLLFLPFAVGEALGLFETVYVIEVVLLWPSSLKAVTVYVKVPVWDVISNPGLVEPWLSLQVAMPGP